MTTVAKRTHVVPTVTSDKETGASTRTGRLAGGQELKSEARKPGKASLKGGRGREGKGEGSLKWPSS